MTSTKSAEKVDLCTYSFKARKYQHRTWWKCLVVLIFRKHPL